MDYSEKRLLQLFISSRHAAELFEFADQSFDHVAFTVGLSVQPPPPFLVDLVWDHWRCASVGWHALSHRRACESSHHALRKASGRATQPAKEARIKSWPWTFLDIEGVEPTNNASERALRSAVIWRKLSFGTQSARGSRFVETILTVVETCHRQSRHSFEYLTATIEAHFAGQSTPSLLTGV